MVSETVLTNSYFISEKLKLSILKRIFTYFLSTLNYFIAQIFVFNCLSIFQCFYQIKKKHNKEANVITKKKDFFYLPICLDMNYCFTRLSVCLC